MIFILYWKVFLQHTIDNIHIYVTMQTHKYPKLKHLLKQTHCINRELQVYKRFER